MTAYFCEGLNEVAVVNGVVRLEFHCLEAVPRGQNRELRPVTEFIVALPLQGFVHALGVLENVRSQFAGQGLTGPSASPESATPPGQRRNRRIFRDWERRRGE
jgi:hypothetical protein